MVQPTQIDPSWKPGFFRVLSVFCVPGFFLLRRGNKVGAVLLTVFIIGVLFFVGPVLVHPIDAFFEGNYAEMKFWKNHRSITDPSTVITFGLSPGLMLILLSVVMNVQNVAVEVRKAPPGTYQLALWQACGRWRGWFFPGLDLCRSGKPWSGMVALSHVPVLLLLWVLTIPMFNMLVLHLVFFAATHFLVSPFFLLLYLVPGFVSAGATGWLWRAQYHQHVNQQRPTPRAKPAGFGPPNRTD